MTKVLAERQSNGTRKSVWLILAVTFAAIAAIMVTNFVLNPLIFNRAQIIEAAKLLIDGKGLAIASSNIDWRELRREQIRRLTKTPDIVIFGGSRWQEATAAVAPGKFVYNAFVTNDQFEDMLGLSELLVVADRLPKILVLSARFGTFEHLDRRDAWWWKSYGQEYRAMVSRIGLTPHSWWDTVAMNKWLHLLSLEALVKQVRLYSTVPAKWKQSDQLQDTVMDVTGPDGGLRFSVRRLALQTPAFAEQDSIERGQRDRLRRLKINETFLPQLRGLVEFLKTRGVQVVFAQTPFHETYYQAIQGSDYFNDVQNIEIAIQRIAKETGALTVGSFDAVKEGCDKADYRDFNHASVRCLSRIIAQIPGIAAGAALRKAVPPEYERGDG